MSTCVAATLVPDSTPRRHLTLEEQRAIAHYIENHGGMDVAGTFGFLSAIASSPTMIPFEEWRPIVHPDPHALEPWVSADFHNLLCIATNMVGFYLANGHATVPEAADFVSFARGYLAGMQLWRIPGQEHYGCAAWACALTGRLDLLPLAERELLEAAPPEETDGTVDLSEVIACLMVLTYEVFSGYEPAVLH